MSAGGSDTGGAGVCGHSRDGDAPDLERQVGAPGSEGLGGSEQTPMTVPQLTIVVTYGEQPAPPQGTGKASPAVAYVVEEVPVVVSPKKGYLSRCGSSHEQCRVCQQDKEEPLIDLGCHCRGGLGKAHRSCIDTWFRSRGSNKCEICQQAATNVPPPEPLPGNSWIWRVDPSLRGAATTEERRTCFSPLWVAFSILIGGLLLDVLISVTLGVSALPVNIIIGVIVVLGLGTALRLTLEFCHEWNMRRVAQRVEANVNLGYHPAL